MLRPYESVLISSFATPSSTHIPDLEKTLSRTVFLLLQHPTHSFCSSFLENRNDAGCGKKPMS